MTSHPATADTPWRSLPGLDRLLVTPSDPAGFMTSLLDALLTIAGIDAAWIGLPDKAGTLIPEIVNAPPMDVLHDPKSRVNINAADKSRGLAGRTWHSGIAHLTSDVTREGAIGPWRHEWLHFGFRVGASIPLSGIGGVHRILTLYSRTPDFFHTTWPVAQLTEFGMVIGTAIESRTSLTALSRAKRLLDTLLVGAETLVEPGSESAVLEAICKRMTETGLFVCAAIGRIEPDRTFRYRIAGGPDAARVASMHQSADDDGPHQLLGLQALNSGVLRTTDSYASSDRLEPWHEIARQGGWQSAAAAPIRRAGAIFAVLFLASKDDTSIDDETTRLIGQLATNIGRALDEIDLKAALRAERETQSHAARHDSLTDLPNRRAFEEALPLALAHAARHNTMLGLGILDLDDFKPINDRHGHTVGDFVLQTLGRRLRVALRDVDFVARLGGDEFALIVHDLISRDRLEAFCKRLGTIIAQPILLPAGTEITVAASLGLTFFPADRDAPDILVRHADIALYAAKSIKVLRPRYWMTYQEQIGAAPAQSHCRTLLAQGRVEVHFQPIIAVKSGRVTAIEALARLRDGERLIAPGEFLPELNAEDRETLLRQVLAQGIACLRSVAAHAPDLHLSVNVDAEVLSRGQVPAIIEAALAGTGITPTRLIVEFLESHDFADHESAVAHLTSLRQAGIVVAIDDLGVEFSTLKRVQHLPVNYIKIDRHFVADVMQNPQNLTFLTGFIIMSASLGLALCIEGVETIDMLDALRILGAPFAQGYGIARPMPHHRFETWLKHETPPILRGMPRTLLGAYAQHMRWLRVFLLTPEEMALLPCLRPDASLSLAPFFQRMKLEATPAGQAYAALTALTSRPEIDFKAVKQASNRVISALAAAIAASTTRTIETTASPESVLHGSSGTPPDPPPQPRQSLAERPVRQTRGIRPKRQAGIRLDAHTP